MTIAKISLHRILKLLIQVIDNQGVTLLNLFQGNVPYLHPLKTLQKKLKEKWCNNPNWVGGWEGVILPFWWFSLNNSKTVKAVTLDSI